MSWFNINTQNPFSILHYEVELNFHPRWRSFTSTTAITLAARNSNNKFSFLLGQQFRVEAINYLGLPLQFRSKHRGQGLMEITVLLPRKANAGEKLVLTFVYSGILPGQNRQAIELAPDDHWYPFCRHPQQYTSSIRMILPHPCKVVASGQLQGEHPTDTRFVSKWFATTASRGLHVLLGEFNRTRREGQQHIDVYYPRPIMHHAQAAANFAQQVDPLLTELLGSSPVKHGYIVLGSDQHSGVRSSFFITSISSGKVAALRAIADTTQRNQHLFQVVAEELAHRRLKHNLAVIAPNHAWYLDGLARYVSWLALEQQFDRQTRERFMEAARQLVISGPATPVAKIEPASQYRFPDWHQARTGWLMRIAHCLAGQGFFPAIRQILAAGNIAPAPEDFFKQLGQLTDTPLEQFFREWVCSANRLCIEILDPRTFRDQQGRWQLVFTLANKGRLCWPHPLDIRLELADGSAQLRQLTVRPEPWRIETSAKIIGLQVDPDAKLLNWAQKHTYTL